MSRINVWEVWDTSVEVPGADPTEISALRADLLSIQQLTERCINRLVDLESTFEMDICVELDGHLEVSRNEP